MIVVRGKKVIPIIKKTSHHLKMNAKSVKIKVMNKLFCILGPTATGKTDLGLFLTNKFNGELIACDSRQVYTGLDIGTGKLPGHPVNVGKSRGYWKFGEVKVWMYDVASLNTQYTVADYVKGAEKVIEDIIKREKVPIIVGGTGFYLKALLEGLPNLSIPVDEKLREELGELTLGQLQTKLQLLSPARWEQLNNSDKQNPRRLLRSIELIAMKPYMERQQAVVNRLQDVSILKIGLTAPREVLYKKVDLRVLDWIKQGIIEEVEGFIKKGISAKRIKDLGLEYRIVADYLDGKISQKDLVKTIQNNIHGYVRRQLTWFKKEKNVHWFDITTFDYSKRVEELCLDWYNQSNDKKD